MDRDARLDALRHLVDRDESIQPTDLVDRWDGWRPSYEVEIAEQRKGVWVSVDEIVGSDPMNVDRLVERRLVRVANLLATGEWDPEYNRVVLAKHPDGDYYVSADGNHRVLAHKYFGYDRIYAEVTVYKWA